MSSYKDKRDKYPDLKVNGRIFPTWVQANYKYYKLPEFAKAIGDEDACHRKTKDELRKYQAFLGKFMDFNSPYKNMLVYHGLGSGKTLTGINIYNVLYNYSPAWNVIILLKATLKEHPWMSDLKIWLQEEEREFRMQNITFVSYDAPNADKLFTTAMNNTDTSKKNLFIIEEAHNFIRNVYSNIESRQGRRALSIYDYIIQDQKDNDGTRVICLSATPAINQPFELGILFNLLRPGIFPKSEIAFNQEFVSTSSYRTINPAKKNLFQRRILGLVSYYIGATPDYYATKTINYVDVVMSKYQDEIYSYFEALEEEMERRNRSKKQSSTTYSAYTRQACNFVFPLMAQGMSGETRPRPRLFKVTEKSALGVQEGRKVDKEKDEKKYYNIQNYLEATDKFMTHFDDWLADKQSDDEKSGHTIDKDIKTIQEKYDGVLQDFIDKETKMSSLFVEMHKCSAKILTCILTILKSPGPVLFYSNYVLMEGIQIFKAYLKYFGFSQLDNKNTGVDNFRYTEYHGGIDKKDRSINLERFKDKENKYGKICKIICISPAGSEGISLYNVRQVHILEPYWNEVRIFQMQGRAVRMCSHKELPMKERHVDVYRYKSVRGGENQKWTTDQRIEDLARGKEGLLLSFLDAIKEAAVDCSFNKAHNSLVQNFKCFQFEEQSLFDDQIGPAYKDDINDDARFDNGSNSTNSQTMRIKVIKIKAVKQLTPDDAEKMKYSDSEYYWYSPETLVVYDYLLQYALGKVGRDSDLLPKKLDKDTYIIDRIINIPNIID
jgi:superfamily II DNA or RNA helicase